MAGKRSAKNSLKDSVSLNYKLQKYIGYADYFNRVPLFLTFQVANAGSDAIEDVDVTLESSDGLILPYTKHLDVLPFESAVEIAAENVVSPLYLTEVSEISVSYLTMRVVHGKEVLCEDKVKLNLGDVLTALSICAATNPVAEKAMDMLVALRGCEAHASCILPETGAAKPALCLRQSFRADAGIVPCGCGGKRPPNRRGKGAARCRTPPPALRAPPLAGEALRRA